MLHSKKKEFSPVTMDYLIALAKDGQGDKVHGRAVWRENGTGERELCLFDLPTREVVSHTEFVLRQAHRARERAKSYPSGRRKVWTRRYAFV